MMGACDHGFDTDRLREPGREPRLALSLAFERTVAGLPSVAELASLIGGMTMLTLRGMEGADGRVR
jgi:hypothetical protein